MPGQDEPRLTLRIGGRSHDDWERFEVDSDLLTPAGGWQLSVGTAEPVLPADVVAGARAELRYGDSVIMTGMIDELSHDVSRGQHMLEITGRDAAAVLVDCSAPVFTAQEMTLQEVITQVIRPLGVTAVRMLSNQLPDADVSGDSDYAIRANAVSGVAQGLYNDQTWILRQIFADTADHDWLVMHARSRDLSPKPASAAGGQVTLTGTAGVNVTSGLQFRPAGSNGLYQTTEDVTIDNDGMATVSASALTAGAAENLGDNTAATLLSYSKL